jgi:hypothetical protein
MEFLVYFYAVTSVVNLVFTWYVYSHCRQIERQIKEENKRALIRELNSMKLDFEQPDPTAAARGYFPKASDGQECQECQDKQNL